MALFTYIVILYLLNSSSSEMCVIDNTPDYITWEKELLKDLECVNYNALHLPGENTTVNITFLLRAFEFNDKTETMTMQTWMINQWNDGRFKWDPEKYHGVNETQIFHFDIWIPYFGITNSGDSIGSYLIFFKFNLKSNGDVHWQYKVVEDASCNLKLTNWPYDLQECNFVFESLKNLHADFGSLPSEHYTINFEFDVLETESAGWYIYDYKHVQENSIKNRVILTVYLMRDAAGLSAIVIWPAFVLTGLSVLSLCLDVRRKVRLAIICVSLLGHYFFLKELSSNIPKESHFPPTLLLYYRGSVVLSIIIVFLTFFLDIMCKLKSTPHNYVKLINDFVYENKYRTYLVYPRWDFDDATVDSKSSSEDWVKFANIVNSVFIFIVVIAYIGLYGADIPKRIYPDKDV